MFFKTIVQGPTAQSGSTYLRQNRFTGRIRNRCSLRVQIPVDSYQYALRTASAISYCEHGHNMPIHSYFAGDMCSEQEQPVKLAMFIQLVLLLLFYRVGNVVHCSTVHEDSIDLQSLLDFKKGITEDSSRSLSSWNTSTHFCWWNGVMCTTARPFRVSTLNLSAQSLAGEITSSLANLTFLSALDLSSNRFFDRFPLLNHLQLLGFLYMNDNSLDGIIPDTLTNCSKMTQIDLSNNQLRGAIPPRIGSLTNLEYLNLGNNSLTGIIPATIGNLIKLGYLNLGMNNLTGIIPATVGNLTLLTVLRLEYNQFEGKIPDGVWQLANLTYLLLGQNRLSGGFHRP